MSPYQVDSFHVCTLYLNPVPADQSPLFKDPISPISKPEDDYFNLPILRDSQAAVLSPGWPRLPSVLPVSNMQPASSTSSSSRGSWSSLFNAGSMRHFMSGVHDSIATPLDALSPRLPVVIPSGDGTLRLPNPESPRRRSTGKDPSPSSSAPLSKSWSEPHVIPPARPLHSQTSSQRSRRPTLPQSRNSKQAIQQKRLIIIDDEQDDVESESVSTKSFLSRHLPQTVYRAALTHFQLERFACHILTYAECLFKWQLMHKRLELLNAVKTSALIKIPRQSQLNFGFGMSYGSSIGKALRRWFKIFSRHAKDVAVR